MKVSTPKASEGSGKSLPLEDITTCCSNGFCAPMARDDADRLAVVLKAVADPVRLQLLSLIKSCGEACACDLNQAVSLSQPTVSHHLKVLADAGLVEREQRGTWAWFRVNDGQLNALSTLFSV